MFGKRVRPLRVWTQKILPLVYDDSLSYYEVLAKVVAKVNELGEFINSNIEELVKDTVSKFFAKILYVEETQSISFIMTDEEEENV